MSNELVNPTFERWVQHIFDHPVKQPEWYWEDGAEFYYSSGNPEQAIDYMSRLFDSPAEHTQSR